MPRLTSSLLLFSSFVFLLSCNSSPTKQPALETRLYTYRFDPPAFVEFTSDFRAVDELPFAVPPHCGLFDVFPAPLGKFMAIELTCPNGLTVLFLDTDSAAISQPITDSDSHFLAWARDGSAAYLKVDSLGDTRVLRVHTGGKLETIQIPAFTYDLAPSVSDEEFTYTFSGGLGQGSELWLARRDGMNAEPLHTDPLNYISFARYSPDGTRIAFIKVPDTQTPFTVGELWVMERNGSNARRVTEADAGHGYAANWSPDGERLAFVVRENPEDERADRLSESLVSNIYVVDLEGGTLTQVTSLDSGRAETPIWSPDGNTLAFNVVINDRMNVHIADLATGQIRSLLTESTCCPAWMRQ